MIVASSTSSRPSCVSVSFGNAGLEVRFASSRTKVQGLEYKIEAGSDYFGFGLCWLEETKEFNRLFQRPAVAALQIDLRKKRRQGEFEIDPEPNEWWLWFEYWERHQSKDLWFWFANDFGEEWFQRKAVSFWEFVTQTYALVIEANKTLER